MELTISKTSLFATAITAALALTAFGPVSAQTFAADHSFAAQHGGGNAQVLDVNHRLKLGKKVSRRGHGNGKHLRLKLSDRSRYQYDFTNRGQIFLHGGSVSRGHNRRGGHNSHGRLRSRDHINLQLFRQRF